VKLVLDPEAIVARVQGPGWVAARGPPQLDEHRRLRADPIAASRSERLLEAERRLRENLWVECEANEAYEHLTVTDGIHCWSFCLTKAGASLGHNKAPARDELGAPATLSRGRPLRQGDAEAGMEPVGRSIVVGGGSAERPRPGALAPAGMQKGAISMRQSVRRPAALPKSARRCVALGL
jgi:hypothetical protein